ncbi:MAG: hypothetical protein U0S36_04775 [Candidatus Nanopelagicales bacterium]
MTEQQGDERDIETIVPADGEDPGTRDGVGERVLSGMGSDGVQNLEGEFGDLAGAMDSDVLAPDGATEAPDHQG